MSVSVWLLRAKRAETRLQVSQLGAKGERGVVCELLELRRWESGGVDGRVQGGGGSIAERKKGWDVICAKASSRVQSPSVNIPIVPISQFPWSTGW